MLMTAGARSAYGYPKHRRVPWSLAEDDRLQLEWAHRPATQDSVRFDMAFSAAIGRTKNSVAMRRVQLGLNVGVERYRDADERNAIEGSRRLAEAIAALVMRMQREKVA